jgi:hypothetical protein
MKVTFIVLIGCFASVAPAEDLKTIGGKDYKNVESNRVEPDGIVIKGNLKFQKSTSLNCLKMFSSDSIRILERLLHTRRSIIIEVKSR